MSAMRFSRQREALIQMLRARSDHPTAEILYHELREVQPNISLGTVYRNLSLLESKGELLRIQSQSGPDRYDGNVAPHNHLHCRECHAVVDMQGAYTTVDLARVRAEAEPQGLRVEGVQVSFLGLCSACAAKAQ